MESTEQKILEMKPDEYLVLEDRKWGRAEILLKHWNFFLFVNPLNGDFPIFNGQFPVHCTGMLAELIDSWE
jgi:hypothetical protein